MRRKLFLREKNPSAEKFFVKEMQYSLLSRFREKKLVVKAVINALSNNEAKFILQT